MSLLRRWAGWLRRGKLEADITAELASHLELRAESNCARGLAPAAARRDAARRLGSELALRERTREADSLPSLEDFGRDLRLALRRLRRAPGFATLAVLTLALGMGASTAMFSVVDAVLLRTLPFPRPDRLVVVETLVQQRGHRFAAVNVSRPAFEAMRASTAFARVGMAGYTAHPAIYVDGTALDASVYLASPGLFAALGATPELGRGFSGAAHEIVVRHRFWEKQFGGDSAALGSSLRVGDQLYSLVGVLAPGQGYPFGADAWIPGLPARGDGGLVVGRLRARGTLAAARAAAFAIGQRPGLQDPKNGIVGLTVTPLRRQLAAPAARRALWLLLGAAGLVLLIAAVNVANLLLAGGLERQREFAVRRALGASRWRLARLALAESLALAALAGVVGCGLAELAMQLVRLGPAAIPRLQAAQLDARALGVAALLALLCGLGCGLASALRLARPEYRQGFQAAASAVPRRRTRLALVAGEVALTMVLLLGALLLTRSLGNLLKVNPGFRPAHVLAFEVAVPLSPTTQPTRTLAWRRRRQLDGTLLARLRSLPGVAAASYTSVLPFEEVNQLPLRRPGDAVSVLADWIEVGPGYFGTLAAPLLHGRDFRSGEMAPAKGATPVLINQALAQAFWPGRGALGQRLISGIGPVTVIGEVGNLRNVALADSHRPQAYFPMVGNWDGIFLLRSRLSPAAQLPAVRWALAATDAGLAIGPATTLDQALAASMAEPRFRTLLLGLFAVLALTLALVGLYGALAYQVRQGRHEIGVRMALGASPAAVRRLVLVRSAAVLAAGLGAGGLLALPLAHLLASLLYGVTPLSPSIWLAAAAVLFAAGLATSALPARRAARVDPAAALRCE